MDRRPFCITLALFFVAVDQISKHLVQNFMVSRAEEPLEIIPGFLNLVSSHNSGVAFGMLRGMPDWLLSLPVVIVVLIMIYLLFTTRLNILNSFAISLIIGGALGNLIDRIRVQKVYDFIDVHAGNYHWPSFNAADSFIVVGVAIFLAWMLLLSDEKKDTIPSS